MIQTIETGRKEDGNRSIADKIIRRLHDIEMTVENNHGRWAWELLQNAKDSVAESSRKVSVEIELDTDSVVFRHNGNHFTEKDIRGLINQISSKEVEEGEESKRTGKFGTGFLTTHLLSKVIQIEGIVKTLDDELYGFSFPLDRDSKTTGQLIPKIEKAWTSFHESTEENQIDEYDEEDFNTSFTYNLESEEQKDVARIGIDEFTELIPFVLAFNPIIDSVNIIDNINNSIIKFENSEELEDEVLLNIIKTENNKADQIKLLFASAEGVAIASIVNETERGYAINDLKYFPKLFCDFPLIGTEDFHFPVIVNSFYFNPLTERDGIWLKGEGKPEVNENREILEKAVELYGKLLEKITELNFYNYYSICISKIPSTNEKYFDSNWYQNTIQKSLREIIWESKVVETEEGKVKLNSVGFPDPDLEKSEREKLWDFIYELKERTLPLKEDIHQWAEIIWENCHKLSVISLIVDLKYEVKNLTKLMDIIDSDENQAIDWLNDCIKFILQIGGVSYFNRSELIPNQEGIFKNRKELSNDEIEDETLKEITFLLGYNYYEVLIHKDIHFEESISTITIQNVAIKIAELIKEDEFINKEKVLAIRKLAEWFEYNPEKGKTHFEALYRKKEKLFVDTIEDKENLYRVLRSKTPLDQLAEIAYSIESDPEILNIINKRKEEIREEIERNKLGEKVEVFLAEALHKYGFNAKSEVFGKDLVISLKKGDNKYAIEVKSTSRASYVSMTPFQVKTAVFESDSYALCVVQNNGSIINKDYIIENARFVVDIGEELQDKFNEVSDFENSKKDIANTNKEIDLYYENNLEYRYKISYDIWKRGKSFVEFVKYISEL